jgi:hypothetical protein
MSDIFEEVEEDYRVEQLLRFWRENAVRLIAILIIAIALGASISFYRLWHERKIEEQTRRLTAALSNASQLQELLPSLTGHRKIAGELALARQQAGSGNREGAIKLYDAVANDGTSSKAETGLAQIASIGLQLDTGDPATLSNELKKISGSDSPYRFSALEWQALLDVRQGNSAEAHKLFATIAADSKAPENIHDRAASLAQQYPGD